MSVIYTQCSQRSFLNIILFFIFRNNGLFFVCFKFYYRRVIEESVALLPSVTDRPRALQCAARRVAPLPPPFDRFRIGYESLLLALAGTAAPDISIEGYIGYLTDFCLRR